MPAMESQVYPDDKLLILMPSDRRERCHTYGSTHMLAPRSCVYRSLLLEEVLKPGLDMRLIILCPLSTDQPVIYRGGAFIGMTLVISKQHLCLLPSWFFVVLMHTLHCDGGTESRALQVFLLDFTVCVCHD